MPRRRTKKGSNNNDDSEEFEYRLKDHISPESDEEIDEDEAFNSEDERKYGSFFNSSSSSGKGKKTIASTNSDNDTDDNSDDEDEESLEESIDEGSENSDDEEKLASDDDDSQQGDGGQYMLDLLDQLDTKPNRNDGNRDKFLSTALATRVKESEFAASIVPAAGLTLDALVDGIKDTQGFGAVQRDLRKVTKGSAVSAAIPKVVSDRAKRKVHYKEQQREISAWQNAVNDNRNAEHLDFTSKPDLSQTRSKLVDKFVPTTDFEKELQQALKKAGSQDEQALLRKEEARLQDDLGNNEITMEQYKKRRGELAKMRALMFYHEQKRHHINKIKSKKYRKIRKKQKERTEGKELDADMQENPDLVRELEEKEEVERMKERASLAHKNTSKWAKRVLRRGNNVDIHTKRALSAQLKRGDELLQRMKSSQKGYNDDSDDDGDNLVESARKVLADTEGDDESHEGEAKGIFKLSFMQKGLKKQQDQAKNEARQLLMELEANEGDFDDDFEPEPSRSVRKSEGKAASKNEMKLVLQDGALVASTLKFGNSDAITIGGSIDIGLSDAKISNKSNAAVSTSHKSETASKKSPINEASLNDREGTKKADNHRAKNRKQTSTKSQQDSEESVVENPWVERSNTQQSTKSNSKSGSKSLRNGIVDVDKAAIAISLSTPTSTTTNELIPIAQTEQAHNSSASKSPAKEKKGVHIMTQEELVQKAFSTVSSEDADADFAREKAEAEQHEDIKVKSKKSKRGDESKSGWGSWTGTGTSMSKPQIQKSPQYLSSSEGPPKRKRADEKRTDVIISAKRMKSLANNFMLTNVPYPYRTREEYERSMSGGIGKEWNVTQSVASMTKPEIIKNAGSIIQPLSKRVKQARPAAKFH